MGSRRKGRCNQWGEKSWARIYKARIDLGLERCRWCRMPNGNQLTFDHIVPKAKGGSGAMDNVTILCTTCNKSKADKLRQGLVSLAAEEAAAPPHLRWSQFPERWDPMWHPMNTPKPDRRWQWPRAELAVAS